LDVDFTEPNPARPDFGAFTLAVAPGELVVLTGAVDVQPA
jgi:hypothetical protein